MSLSNAFQVTFEHCLLPYVPHNFFHRLQNIHQINLELCGVETINSGKFADGSQLEKLWMSFNELIELPAVLFSNTPHIQEIDFSYNKINHIHPKAFHGGTKKLMKLDLSGNCIGDLDKNVFASLLNLMKLDLSYNSIEHFDVDLSNLTELVSLSINNNKIVQLDCNIFSKVTSIDASTNRLREIDWSCESSFLFSLNLADNLLSNLTLSAVGLSKTLRILNVARNKIETISIENDLPKLKELDLMANNLKNISAISEHCVALKLLGLSNNNIQQLDANAFVKMTNLEYLYLQNTSLTEVVHGTFSHQRNLIELDLSHNKLNHISFDLFLPYFENLTELRLNDNHLANLVGWMDSIFPKLGALAISNNDFNCSYLAEFLRQFKTTTIHLAPSSTVTMHTAERNSIHGISCIDIKDDPAEKNITFDVMKIPAEDMQFSVPNGRNNNNDQLISTVNRLLIRLAEEKANNQPSKRVESILSSMNFLLIFLCIVSVAFILLTVVTKCKRWNHHHYRTNERNTIYLQENDAHQSSTTLNTVMTVTK